MVIGGALIALVGLMSFPRILFESDQTRAKELLRQACVSCRLEGQPDSRVTLRASFSKMHGFIGRWLS